MRTSNKLKLGAALAALLVVNGAVGQTIPSGSIVPLSDGSTIGKMKGDGSTITCSSGVCTATAGGTAGINQLTGDVTAGPASGSAAATLANTAVTAASYGSSTSIPSFTVDAKGRLTAAAGNAVVAPAGTLTGATLAAGVTASSLTSVGTLSALTVSGTTTFSGITGSTQCLHVNTSGVLSGSGSDCGSGGGGGLTVGTTTITSGTSGRIEYNNAGVLGELATTGSGNVVLATSPTLVTPVLGTPTSVTLTNATGLPVATGISGLGTGVATALATNVSGSGAICLASGSACSGGATNLTINSSTVTGGSANALLYGDGSVVQNAALTAGTANVVITAPTTISTTAPVKADTTTAYMVLTGDNTKLVSLSNSSPVAVTLPQAGSAGFASGWSGCWVNVNTGLVTITTTTSTINGSGSTVKLPQGASACLASDGTDWKGTLSIVQIPGTSGGIPYYAATNELLSSGALTANLPVIGGGAGAAPTVGSRSGNTTVFATASGSLTNGDLLKADANGNIVNSLALGTLTDGDVCTYTASGTVLNCNTSIGGGGNVSTSGSITTNGYPYWASATTVASSAAPTNGQIMMGSTGSAPVLGTITAGSNITVTNGAGSITIASTGGSGIGTKIATCALASTTCNFNSLGSHDYYVLKCTGVTTSTTADVEIRVNADSTSGDYRWTQAYLGSSAGPPPAGAVNNSDTRIEVAGTMATTSSLDVEITFGNIASTTLSKKFFYIETEDTNTPQTYSLNGSGAFTQTGTAITSVQFLTSTGTFGSGANKCTLYAYDA